MPTFSVRCLQANIVYELTAQIENYRYFTMNVKPWDDARKDMPSCQRVFGAVSLLQNTVRIERDDAAEKKDDV